MNLAPNVIFDEEKHEYFYMGKQLSGVTGLISKKLGLKYGNEFVSEAAEEGVHVHKAVQRWVETGDSGSVHPGVRFVVSRLGVLRDAGKCASEVLVSDFKRYASAVDIVVDTGQARSEDKLQKFTRLVNVYDLKTGKFNRGYVTWQLSIYKYFIERFTKFGVKDCLCLALKDQEVYQIFPKCVGQVEGLLYGG